jgi:leucyl aminopeptidase
VTALALSARPVARVGVEAVVLPFHRGPRGVVGGAGVTELARAWGTDLTALVRADRAFGAEVGQVCLVLGTGSRAVVIAVGLGPEATAGPDQVRDAALAAARRTRGYRRVATTLSQVGPDRPAATRAAAEGLLLGCFDYRAPGRPEPAPRAAAPEQVLLVVDGEASRDATVRRALDLGVAGGRAASWVRQLVETPAGALTPSDLADVLTKRAREVGVTARVWNARSLSTKGFGGVLGVGAGSANPPVVVELRSGAGPQEAVLGLAGKGITFDSGGLNLKRDPDEISWMKSDMAAAAAVAGAVFAAAELGAGAGVHTLLPLAENMPGGRACRPGDVLTHPGGRTTEVTDTDCEGRLVLADAIGYLAGTGPGAIVDVGTLTDGGGVGNALWGCWGTDLALAADLVAAGQAAGDPGWVLPLRPEYQQFIGSRVADAVNCSQEVPDSGQMAATYLRSFAGTVPWVHVDNGSSAYLELDRDPWPKGPTGSPVRALLELLVRRSATTAG